MKQEINKDQANLNIENNKRKNVDEILLKMKEAKKNEVINDIKRQLLLMNNKQEKNNDENTTIGNESTIEVDNSINNRFKNKIELQGFIKIQSNFQNIKSLITLLRQYLKSKGYSITNKDLDNLTIEVSNGEMDVKLILEKMFKEIKIYFAIINGNREDYSNFKKIMKKFNINN